MFGNTGDLTSRLATVTEYGAVEGDDLTLAAACLTDAYNAIKAALIARGLSDSQVDLWTQGAEYELDIGTYLFCQRKGFERRQESDRDWLQQFDRRDELATIPLLLSDGTVVTADTAGDYGHQLFDIDTFNQDRQ